ncbi:MAG: protease modulator HflC, partial [Bdellovibrionales bacterium]|nr:protease modulator HflC [Bdellovibrionales bacterium]
IDKVFDSATKSVISSYAFVESVRNTNQIFDQIEAQQKARKDREALGGNLGFIQEEVIGEIPRVRVGRERLSQEIIEKAKGPLKEFGIQLIDVQLRRIGYKEGVEKEVHDRMISERQRIAERIRSVGKGEQEKIKGTQELELQSIESEAYKQVQEIRGRAEAEAIEIYAQAVGKDKEFYQFIRTLEAYRTGLREDSSFILSADSPLFKVLQDGME